ncbi:MAG: InlB B-repeat-containing protein [Eubacteriaceae bacterium]|nr:InlB B-repeat-containing protein [Eubacteriaceae bacterium]
MKNRKSKQNSIPKLFLLLLALLMTGAVFNAKIMVAFAEGENITYEFTLTHTNTVPTTFSTVTFTTDGSYTLTDAAGSPYTDLDTVTPGIQVNTGAAFFDFKIVPTAENTVTGVSVAPVSPNVENANLYSPDADGVYRISNEKTTFDNGVKVITPCGNQTVTVTTAQTANITYDANGGAGTTPPTVSYEGESINLAWPADIGITPQTGYYFAGWNTQADGLGTSYTAGQTISVPSGGLTLYAQWNNTAAPFTAKLYDDNNYITYTELTEGGAVTNWVSTKQDRYLRIDANFTNGGTISITLPTGMALFDDNYTKQVGHATMANEPVFIPYDEDPNANGYQQGTGTYSNAKTGTLTYTFLTNANSDFMIIPVTFDQTIWDRSTGLANLSGDKPAITVAMTTGAGTGTTYTKALSKVLSSAGDGPFIYTDYWPDNVPIDDERVSMSYSSVRNADTYWRTLKMEYFLPQKTVNEADTGTYAEYIGESISSDTSWNGYTLVQTTANYTVDSSDPTKLIYTWTNHKQSNILYLSPVLYFPSGEFSNNDSLRFTVKLTGETYSGAVISKTKICTAKAVDKKAKVTINTSPKSIYQFNYPSEIRNILGSISLKNEGLIDSGKLKVTFTFDSANLAGSGNHNIDVSAFSLPQTNMTGLNPSTFSAECTMVNADNSVSFTHTMTSLSKHSSYTNNQYGRLLLASDVVTAYNTANPTNQVSGDWYFKTVTYEIPEIPHNSTLYYPTAQSAFDKLIPSGGNFYGRINAHATTTLDVKEWNKETSAWGDAITANIQSTKTSALTTTLYVGGVTFNGNSNSQTITAGDSLSMTVPLQLHSYPYGTTQYNHIPRGFPRGGLSYSRRVHSGCLPFRYKPLRGRGCYRCYR